MKNCSIFKKVVALFFSIFIVVNVIKNASVLQMTELATTIRNNTLTSDSQQRKSQSMLEDDFVDELWKKRQYIDVSGYLAKLFNIQSYYSDMGMYITDDRYIVSASPYTTGQYEYEQIVDFYSFLQQNGINMLYVNEPTKYIDDNIFVKQFGIESYSNRNMDSFISKIRDAGIPTIDLRDHIEQDGLRVEDLFYRTDHHWTTEAGLWASKYMAEGLNEYCGYSIDSSLYNQENFQYNSWNECWLGEQGRKMASSYVGLDDYTEIKPLFPTSYVFNGNDGEYQGTFDSFIDENVFNIENDIYKNTSWHYAYHQIDCINNNVDYGKVLILGDSYEHVTEPFLSLGIHETDSLVLREASDQFNVRDYIIDNQYDTVIICYAQFMLGAHDDPMSANYKMYSFE